jgi:hypothetical protein
VLAGYPVETVPVGNRGKLYFVPEFDYTFSKDSTQPRVYSTPDFTSYPGNSGGAVCAQYAGKYYPAAIYLGGVANTLVCAIDSGVVDLINRAEVSGNGGGNNTGGGVIIITPNLGNTGFVAAYVQIQLGPPSAVAAGAAWRIIGTNAAAFGSLTNFTNYTGKIALNNGAFGIEFKDLPGWTSPSSKNIEITANQNTIVPANYSVNPPALLISASNGLRITGTTNTLYRIETIDALPGQNWSTLVPSLTLSNRTNTILGTLPTNPTKRFYRAVWLQQ